MNFLTPSKAIALAATVTLNTVFASLSPAQSPSGIDVAGILSEAQMQQDERESVNAPLAVPELCWWDQLVSQPYRPEAAKPIPKRTLQSSRTGPSGVAV